MTKPFFAVAVAATALLATATQPAMPKEPSKTRLKPLARGAACQCGAFANSRDSETSVLPEVPCWTKSSKYVRSNPTVPPSVTGIRT